MLNNTWPAYVFIRAIILLLHSIGPLCTAYTLTIARRAFLDARPPYPLYWPALTPFQYWCAAESAFFLFFLWSRRYLQREAVHPPLRSKEERKKLFDKVRSEIHDVEKFLSGWFRGAKIFDIGREDLKIFLNWAFWEGRAEQGHEDELEEYTQKVEKVTHRQFKQGHWSAKALRLTIDPVEMEWRSLLWYAVMMLADTVCHARLRWFGFQYYWSTPNTIAVFPPRPAAMMESKQSPAKTLSYWLRPHTSTTRLPVLFLHGIGVGLIPFVDFMHELDTALNADFPADDEGQVGILAIETLQVSSRLTHAILTRPEFLAQLTQVLDHHDFTRFVMISHSYGSVLSTHILTHEPLASRVSATLLVDPVSVLLHMPDVAYNFTVRKPRHANEWQLWYFASKDPGTAHTLGRHFFWSENVLWRDRIMELVEGGMRLTASLGEKDLIVDTEAVGLYLTEGQVLDPVVVEDGAETGRKHMESEKRETAPETWKERKWRGKGLEVLWWDGFDHAQVFDLKETRGRLVDVLVEYSKGR